MTKVRLLVGTHKGAFVLTSDERRQTWKVDGPHFAGWDVYHLKGSPVDPNRLYAAQSRGWFGQVVQRSDDGGKTWQPLGNERKHKGNVNTPQWADNTDHPSNILHLGQLDRTLSDTSAAGAFRRDASLSKSTHA